MTGHRLFYSRTSPYARKVLVFAIETNQADDFELIETDVWKDNQDHIDANPLGKVPALVTPSNQVIYDSLVICDYLDLRHSFGRLIPAGGYDRWRILTRHALAHGIMDASLARRWEYKFRPGDQQSPYWMERQETAIWRALGQFESHELPSLERFSVDGAGLACALSYLDLRKELLRIGKDWKLDFPKAAAWLDIVSQRVSMLQSMAD
ncbi:glutathione S-transferase family protein [Bradyrhizobium sp. AUGA SZCCT0431]|uniref:glutathione S-transferase family protein n=1 Tax=Bradyrhizobium sp. AUGA SZCCT0431 TaxID=2807674 RepID=UPI001BAE245E|nr:glutathione S-transferase N-terminal domain-containing protein [Bradyrhizobium sp. AUGA SZCCT0431]MBR1146166.1 glutathione S-transferase N-terminal domain-containing protein [Bradyrhizobium sp. AUGA SZCCT0431]